jgi:ribosome biogenesis protein UTP30
VVALLKHIENTQGSKKSVLLDGEQVISLIVALRKIPEKGRVKPKRVPIPHSLNDPSSTEICLIVKEDAKETIKEALTSTPVPGLTKVIGLSKLRKNYGQFVERRKLCGSYDLFLCDDRIIPLMPKALGKDFYTRKKHPIPVKVMVKGKEVKVAGKKSKGKKDPVDAVASRRIHAALSQARDSTYFYLGWGPCSAIRIAKSSMNEDEVVANIMCGMEAIVENVPKKWKGIQALHIKTAESVALPIWNSLPTATLKVAADQAKEGPKKTRNKVEKRKREPKGEEGEEEAEGLDDEEEEEELEFEDDEAEEEEEVASGKGKKTTPVEE